MNTPEEIKYNEQYTQWNKYNSIENLPQEIVFQKKHARGYWLLFLGVVLIIVDIILATIVFKHTHGIVGYVAILAFVALAAGIYNIAQKQKIILDSKTISIKQDRIEWTEIDCISKYSFQAFFGLNFKNIIIETKDNRKFEFTYNFLNQSSSDIEQLVYMFWNRATKTNVNSN